MSANANDSTYLMFCGSYSNFDVLAHLPHNIHQGKGIYCFQFRNGILKPLKVIPSLNPAVLSLYPSSNCNSKAKTFYALQENIKVNNGIISKIDFDYKINQNNDIQKFIVSNNDSSHNQTNGRSLCYFSIDPLTKKYGIAINYWEGSVDVFKMNNKNIDTLYKHIEHIDIARSFPNALPRRLVQNRKDHWSNRMVGPHAHSVHFYKQWVFIPDLGENSIFQYAYNINKHKIMKYESHYKLRAGVGPRHMVFHPILKIAYVSMELDLGSVCVLRIDDTKPSKIKNRLTLIQNIKTYAQRIANKKNYVAEIAISSDGKFLYCSNRGYDTIVAYAVLIDGLIKAISYVNTFGLCPRHFAITPDNNYLIGANQDSNNLVVYKRNKNNGKLDLIKTYERNDFVETFEFAAPNFLLFYSLDIPKSRAKL